MRPGRGFWSFFLIFELFVVNRGSPHASDTECQVGSEGLAPAIEAPNPDTEPREPEDLPQLVRGHRVIDREGLAQSGRVREKLLNSLLVGYRSFGSAVR